MDTSTRIPSEAKKEGEREGERETKREGEREGDREREEEDERLDDFMLYVMCIPADVHAVRLVTFNTRGAGQQRCG